MELFQGSAITRASLALIVRAERAADIRAFRPAQAEPTQIFQHGSGEIQAEANGVQVIITQDQGASGSAGAFSGDPERARMSKMEVARR